MNVVWSSEAIDDLVSLRSYISESDPTAAQRVALHILHHVEIVLAENPDLGRIGRVADTREAIVPKTSFIVPYRVREGTLEILRVYHVARRWPEIF
jgi:toxin ParE1/3/4